MSTYLEILRRYVESSRMSKQEIARKCSEYGVSFHRTYISNLLHGHSTTPPSHEISRAIALATGNDPEPLILAALLEKEGAVPEIKNMIHVYLSVKSLIDELCKTLVKISLKDELKNEYLSELKKHIDDDAFWAQMDITKKIDIVKLIVSGGKDDKIENVFKEGVNYLITEDINHLINIVKNKKKIANIIHLLSDLDNDQLDTMEKINNFAKKKIVKQGVSEKALLHFLTQLTEASHRDILFLMVVLDSLKRYKTYF